MKKHPGVLSRPEQRRLSCVARTRGRLARLRASLAKSSAVGRLSGRARRRTLARLVRKRRCTACKTIGAITQVIRPRRNEIRATPLKGVLLVAAALALAVPASATALEQKLIVPGGAADDYFGNAVAVDGDIAVVGAPREAVSRGAVYVFKRTGDGWAQTARLTASDAAVGDQFGSSVAIDGGVIVAGAKEDNIGGKASQGSAYTFTATGTEIAKLVSSDGAVEDRLGSSVAISGSTVSVAAPYADVNGKSEQGAAYTFSVTGTQTAKLTASDGAADDFFGTSVAILGGTVVAGAPFADIAGKSAQGSAYTFTAAGTQTGKLTASDGAVGDHFGGSVAIDGGAIVAGAPGDDIGGKSDQGSAYTFTATGAEIAKFVSSDGAVEDRLGVSVGISGGTVVAGAPTADVGGKSNQGAAYTFSATGTQTAKLMDSDGAADDSLGYSVAISGGTIVAGAPLDDLGSNLNQGSASVFYSPTPPAPPPPVRPAGLKPGACSNQRRGTAAPDILTGTAAGDLLAGLSGDDSLFGLGGDDCLLGDAGADKLSGGDGADKLAGGAGGDRLSGGSGNDRLSGGSGDDRLSGGRGRNRYSAGSGNDTVSARNRKRERVDCGPGRDRATVDRSDRVRRCERVRRR